jgi:GNAT superfamily N-acetyltransferase
MEDRAVPGDAARAGAVPASAVPAALVTVRQATPGDRDALTEMFGRCTPRTRYRRFHGGVTTFPRRYLDEALSRSPAHHALVASAVQVNGKTHSETNGDNAGSADDSTPADAPGEGGQPALVALASCRVVDEGMAEVGILVEDGWQRHGVGSALLDELVVHARALGLRALTAQLLTEQAWTAGMLGRYGPIQRSLASRGVVTVTVRLTPREMPSEAPGETRGEAPAVAMELSCRLAATRSASA